MMWPTFNSPWFLLGLLLIPLLLWRYIRLSGRKEAGIRFPSLGIIKRIPKGTFYHLRHSLIALRLAAIAFIVIALARPQYGESLEEVTTSGVDIVLILDVSTSMKVMDFKPKNRLVVAKQILEDFILGRRHDRIGLVVFAGKSYTQSPLTLDYGILVQFLRSVDFGIVEDGTAIGTGILNGVNRLKSSDAKSKVAVLLTDGENNAGEVSPMMAARAAKAMGVKVHTIGVGKDGDQPMEIDDPVFGKRIVSVPTKMNEEELLEIATLTGGQYYRAQDPEALRNIFAAIDELEKTEIHTTTYNRYHELFYNLLLVALGLLFAEIILANTRFMKIP